uniref:Dopamine beta-hydroxylase n=1 Tax=Salmo trutta TaxID=8032 RepID=A0A673X9G3_SALTR
MYLTVLLTTLVVILVASYQVDPATSPSWGGSTPLLLPYHMPLDPRGHLHLSRNISYPLQELYLEVRGSEMKHGLEGHYDSRGRVSLDSQQDYRLMAATQTPERFSPLFKRSFSTCDPQDYIIEEGTVHLIYGVLDRPIRLLQQLKLSQIETGVQRARLLCPDTPSPSLKVNTMESIPEHFPPPPLPPPPLPPPVFFPLQVSGNKAIVHHMEVFECSPEMDTVPQYSRSCDSKMKSASLNYCRHILAAWAMGAEVTKHCRDGTSHTQTRTPHLGSNSICFLSSTLAVLDLSLSGAIDKITYKKNVLKEVEVVQEDKHFTQISLIWGQTQALGWRMMMLLSLTLLCDVQSSGQPHWGFGIMEEMCDNYSNVDHGYLQKYFSLINRFVVLLEGEPSPQSEVLSRFSSRISLYFAPSIFSSILTCQPVPAAEKQPHSMIMPPPCFIVGMVPGFLQT